MKTSPWSLSDCLWCLHGSEEPWHSGRWLPTPPGCPYGLQILCTWKFICHQMHIYIYLSSTFQRSENEIKTQLNAYALSDKRCSQQLHAIANPSEEEVALPSSSMTIKLLHFQAITRYETECEVHLCQCLSQILPVGDILHYESGLPHLCHKLRHLKVKFDINRLSIWYVNCWDSSTRQNLGMIMIIYQYGRI